MADVVAPENLFQKLTSVFKRKGNPPSQNYEVRYVAPPDRKEIARQEQKRREERVRAWKMEEAGQLKTKHLEEQELLNLRRKLKART